MKMVSVIDVYALQISFETLGFISIPHSNFMLSRTWERLFKSHLKCDKLEILTEFVGGYLNYGIYAYLATAKAFDKSTVREDKNFLSVSVKTWSKSISRMH